MNVNSGVNWFRSPSFTKLTEVRLQDGDHGQPVFFCVGFYTYLTLVFGAGKLTRTAYSSQYSEYYPLSDLRPSGESQIEALMKGYA